ncbi:MAG: hypothetical protein ABR598_08145 [Candidatus Dormibacteria bacterium]
MSPRVLHVSLASVTAAAAFALVASGMYALVRRSAYSIRLTLLVRRVAVIAALLTATLGIVLMLAGRRPHDGLHLMYGILAVVVVPAAATMAARNPRRGALYHAGAGLLLLGFCLRLSTTG